jgi:hypothetical protein
VVKPASGDEHTARLADGEDAGTVTGAKTLPSPLCKDLRNQKRELGHG